jgi:hypothetical protein
LAYLLYALFREANAETPELRKLAPPEFACSKWARW